MQKLKMCLAQMEVVPANPQANLKKILEFVKRAKNDKADIIVFPEMCVPGYILGDMWERKSFIEECIECGREIIKASQGIVVVYGNVEEDSNKVNEDGRIRKYNTSVIATNGSIVDVRIKSLQPNYREFDDNRHFYDYRKLMFDDVVDNGGCINIEDFLSGSYSHSILMKNGTRIGVMMCEDGWDNDYSLSPSQYLFPNCNVVLNLSCSPFTYGKADKRNRVFSNQAKKYGKPLVYVNCVGVQNNGKTIYTFDGDSCIYDKNGNQFNPYTKFDEGCETFEIDLGSSFEDQTLNSTGAVLKGIKIDRFYDIGVAYNTFKVSKDDIGTIHKSIVYGAKKFMESIGIKKVVIGASGGIDSAVVATIMRDIVGSENMILVNMPSKFNSDLTKNAAEKLAKNLGCRYVVHSIQGSVDATKMEIRMLNTELAFETVNGIINNVFKYCKNSDDSNELSSFAIENVQARDRSSRILAAWAAWFGGAFTCNANKTEMTVGYTTLYGDLGGFVAILADLWKGQVYELARYINDINGMEIIPLESINVVPSAELSDKQDVTKGLGDPLIYPYHDKLFSSWVEKWDRATPEDNLRWYLDGTLGTIIGYEGDVYKLFPTVADFTKDLEKWWGLFTGLAVCKRVQSPPLICVSKRGFGYDMRESITNSHYSVSYLKMKKDALK